MEKVSDIVIVIVLSILAVALCVLICLLLVKRERTEIKEEKVSYDDSKWVNALGGKENISKLEAKGSRLICYLNDNEKIDNNMIHELGALSVIKSKEKVTIVLSDKAENISNLLG